MILVVLDSALALGLGLDFTVAGLDLTIFDLIGLGIAGGMVALLAGRASRNLRQLARREPAGSRWAR